MSHQLLEQVAAVVRPHENFLVALSGGADSVALLAALVELGHRCRAVHCNYHLRGDESNRDEQHARDIAARLGVEIDVIQCDVDAYRRDHSGESVEMACRTLRYDVFKRLLSEHSLDSIAIGHHLEDNIETMFINMMRGTGIKGLAGMRPRRGVYVRPMLQCTKPMILDYLEYARLDYVTDSSNLTNDYRRNALRNDILPALRRFFPDAENGLRRTLDTLASQRDMLENATCRLEENYGEIRSGIDLRSLVDEEPDPVTALFELLNMSGNNVNIDTVRNMVASAHKSGLIFSGINGTFLLDHGRLVPAPSPDDEEFAEIQVDINNLDTLSPVLSYSIITPDEFKPERDPSVAYFDLGTLMQCEKIVLRSPRNGDRIKPWGMKGSRLLSDIFSDLHLPHEARRKARVLEANGNILWLIGYRASRCAPVTPATRRILRLTTHHP